MILKQLEEKILNADERISILEDLIFNQICDEISKYKADILLMSNDVSIIDSIYSFYLIANNNKWIKPILSNNKKY